MERETGKRLNSFDLILNEKPSNEPHYRRSKTKHKLNPVIGRFLQTEKRNTPSKSYPVNAGVDKPFPSSQHVSHDNHSISTYTTARDELSDLRRSGKVKQHSRSLHSCDFFSKRVVNNL